jgi:hypothetical protein
VSRKQKTLKGEIESHLKACRKWTSEREDIVYQVVRSVMGSSASSLDFYARALNVLKAFTNPKYFPGQIVPSPIRTQLRYLRGLTDGVHKAGQQLRLMTADYGQALPHLSRIWRSDAARLKRWGEFDVLLSPLFAEVEAVCKIAESTLKGLPGGQTQKRRNLIVAELAEVYESCFHEQPERSARGKFARLMKVIILECGFSVDRISDVVAAGLRERNNNRKRNWRPGYIQGLGTATGEVIKTTNK